MSRRHLLVAYGETLPESEGLSFDGNAQILEAAKHIKNTEMFEAKAIIYADTPLGRESSSVLQSVLWLPRCASKKLVVGDSDPMAIKDLDYEMDVAAIMGNRLLGTQAELILVCSPGVIAVAAGMSPECSESIIQGSVRDYRPGAWQQARNVTLLAS